MRTLREIQEMIDSLPSPALVYDPATTNVLIVGQAFAAILSYEVADFIGMSLSHFCNERSPLGHGSSADKERWHCLSATGAQIQIQVLCRNIELESAGVAHRSVIVAVENWEKMNQDD
jgi:hypothetical protein